MNETMSRVALIAAAVAVGAGCVFAESEWQYKVSPYAWLAGLDGDVGARGLVAPVEQDFSDLVDNVDLALMLGGEAHNGTWGGFVDGMYMELEDDKTTAAGKVSAEVEQWLVSAGALYRVMADDKISVDVGAGGRYIDVDLDLGTPRGDASGSQNWIDPILVARLQLQLVERVFLQLAGEIGGFGVESDLVWQLTGSAGYQLTDAVSLLLGYRYLDYDYEENGIVYDAATMGVGAGVTIEF